jgi:hypothetical protein
VHYNYPISVASSVRLTWEGVTEMLNRDEEAMLESTFWKGFMPIMMKLENPDAIGHCRGDSLRLGHL